MATRKRVTKKHRKCDTKKHHAKRRKKSDSKKKHELKITVHHKY